VVRAESITNTTATNVGCDAARFVARGAHGKALGPAPSATAIRTFTFNGGRADRRPAGGARPLRRDVGGRSRAPALPATGAGRAA
jgi:hypothetical protein